MLRRAGHARLGSASASLVQLAAEEDDLFIIPATRQLGTKSGVGRGKRHVLLLKSHVLLLKLVNLLTDQLSFLDLLLDWLASASLLAKQ